MDPDALINGYLDDQLTTDQTVLLNAWLREDPENARRFALAQLQHIRLRDAFQTVNDAGIATPQQKLGGRFPRRRVLFALALAASVVVAALVLMQGVGSRRAAAAEAQLNRLIAAADQLGDRTYRITALEGADLAEQGGGRPQPTVDGALLHVRGDGQYVLIRRPGTPEVFVTGSDGREAWSIPPDGPVRVSPDATRFRGVLPGEQQGLPFLDLKSALGRLREAYRLDLDDDADAPVRQLRARKRSPTQRGPREVSVWFDASSGVIRRMRLDGMPQARGGPRSVVLDLVGENDLGPDFFTHERHHSADRRVIRETQ